MSFLDEVQAWIRSRLDIDPDREAAVRAAVEAAREARWEALESLPDQVVPHPQLGDDFGSNPRRDAHRRWTEPGYVEGFARSVAEWLLDGLARGWVVERLARAVRAAVYAAVQDEAVAAEQAGDELAALELDRLVKKAVEGAPSWGPRWDSSAVEEWCRNVYAIDAGGRPTAIGRALVGLAGRDAVHLALELEMALSTGPGDSHRAARSLFLALRFAVGKNLSLRYDDNSDPREHAPFSYRSLERLESFGVVDHFSDFPADRFSLEADAIALVDALLDPAPNPIRALVESLLASRAGEVRAEVTGQPSAGGLDPSYVRMVVHEVRNAVLPVADSVDRLRPALDAPGGPEPGLVGRLLDRIERAVDRLDRFTQESARLAELPLVESFGLRAVLEDAVAATEAERNGRIEVDVSGAQDAAIEGHRGRWVLLFVNLVRNSVQARAGSGRVTIRTEETATGALRVYVDDDGPGIPEELRERIFDAGFSARGSSGLGLADARVTAALSGGFLTCGASPQGGARFLIQVPARRRV